MTDTKRNINPENQSPEGQPSVQYNEKPGDLRLLSSILRLANSWAGLYWPVFIAIVLMLPRLASAHFGLLDDGVTLSGSRAILNDNIGLIFTLGGQSGRFSPAILLFYALVYWVGGSSPFFFFCVNTLILAAIAAGLIWLVYSLTGSRAQAWITCLLFVLSGPVVENFYTVTKGEPLQAVWMTASVGLLTVYGRIGAKWRRALAFGVILAALFLAMSTKETGVVIMPISLGWFLISLWWKRRTREPVDLQCRFAYVVASVIAGIGFFALRSHFVSPSLAGGGYTQYYRLEWTSLIISTSRWLAWLTRDFPFLLPIAVFVAVALFQKRLAQRLLLVDSGIWMAGWIVVCLPWHSVLEYYLLPFALGCAVFCGSALIQMVRIQDSSSSKPLRVLASVCFKLCLVFVCVALANNVTNFRLQLAVDDANADAVDFIAGLPPNSRVAVNLPESSEYFYELGLHLSDIRKRPDISLKAFAGPNSALPNIKVPWYILTPVLENQLLPSIRIALDENSVGAWNRSLAPALGNEAQLTYRAVRHVQLLDFGLHRICCLFSHQASVGIWCNYPRPFIETRVCRYGWKVYRISQANH